MVWLFIVLAMVLMVGPIMWLRPNKRQRRLASLRQAAFSTGANCFPINIQKDAFYSKTLARNPHLDQQRWVRYEWVADDEDSGPSQKERWVQRRDLQDGTLLWESGSVQSVETRPIAALLTEWREHQDSRFLSLELGPRSVAIVWDEQGDSAELEAMASHVKALLGSA